MAEALLHVSSLRRWRVYAEARGLDGHALLEGSGIAPAVLDDPESLLPLRAACAFFDAVAHALHDPCVGLDVALKSPIEAYGLLGAIFRNAPTVGEACEEVARDYTAFLAGSRMRFERGEEGATLALRWEVDAPGHRQVRLESVASIFIQARHLMGTQEPAVSAFFVEAPEDPARFHDVFGPHVTFGARDDGFVIPLSWLDHPNPHATRNIFPVLRDAAVVHAERRRAAAGADPGILRLKGCVVDLVTGMVQRSGEVFQLTPRERDVLAYFVEHANEVVTHDDLERKVWGFDGAVVTHAPAVAVRRLREKIEVDRHAPVNLVTVFGDGWRLVMAEGVA